MSELLLEIFCEEIPARMQKRAMEDLSRMMTEGLTKAGIAVGEVKTFVAPRRLGLCIDGLPNKTPEVREEKKGPKTSAPSQAIDGFVRAAGIASIEAARIEKDDKKGDFYVVDIIKPGAKTSDIIAELVPQIVRSFPWPKSMRWGEGALRWVRPIHSILCVFEGAVVSFEIDGIVAGNQTLGHRFHSTGIITANNFADYESQLRAKHVLIDREERKQSIANQSAQLCAQNGLELIEDIGLLEEVCGLIDEPHVILGQMDESFLDLPPEVIRLTLRINQKYFVVNSKDTGKLAPYFIVVSNVKAVDGGKAIAHGNARVLSARLNDARYFWDLDRKQPLESRVAKLDTLVFHEKLGSVGDKVKRIVELAGEIAPLVGADVEDAKRAALLCKADLSTEMVGEFPELQGIMGRYYASLGVYPPLHSGGGGSEADGGGASVSEHAPLNQSADARSARAPSVAKGDSSPVNRGAETADVSNAIAEHYKPVGPSDNVPTNPVSIAVALADKFDTLVGFFAIGEKPTGSGDPYALRRAALGIIRIVDTNKINIWGRFFIEKLWPLFAITGKIEYLDFANDADMLESFIEERIQNLLKDEGITGETIEAASNYAGSGSQIWAKLINRIRSLHLFLKTDDGANLLAGYKRAANILKAEEKKGAIDANLSPDPQLFKESAEIGLYAALTQTGNKLEEFLQKEDFAGALGALSSLRAPIYAFLDDVLVNDKDESIRANRLALLVQLRHLMAKVADFESIRG